MSKKGGRNKPGKQVNATITKREEPPIRKPESVDTSSSSRSRWWIRGILKTVEPLHIGSGESAEVPGLETHETGSKEEPQNRAIKANLVAKDSDGRAYIPGSALKGCLRSFYAGRLPAKKDSLDKLFGSADAAGPDSVGAKLVFHDACFRGTAPEIKLPWNSRSLTAIATGVSIDRHTGTAADHKLFNVEYVPPGVEFRVEISGNDLDPDEVALLLGLLKTASHAGLRVGAGAPDSYGKVKWVEDPVRHVPEVKSVSSKQINEWLNSNGWTSGGGVRPGTCDVKPIRNFATEIKISPETLSVSSASVVELRLRLEFDGGFLVNSPHDADRTADSETPFNHIPIKDASGKIILPASAFRGPLRSQAEKIVRTIGHYACDGGSGKDCAVKNGLDDSDQCLVCRLFGSPGWKSPIQISNFVPTTKVVQKKQEFLAVDRFTGGSAAGKKFNAMRAIGPTFEGTVRIDVERLMATGAGQSATGLMALTMRDLLEGDITFGFGAAKGYGAVRHAEVTGIYVSGVSKITETFGGTLTDIQLTGAEAISALYQEVRALLENAVGALVSRGVK